MEFVFVVPRAALFPEFYPQGLVPFREDARGKAAEAVGCSLQAFESALAREGFFVERAYAERTPSLKQVIPYSVVECGGEVLLTQRLARGGESRLHGKASIGIGGHINPEDLDGAARDIHERSGEGASPARNPVEAGTRREIAEELLLRGDYTVRRVGLLNDDSNPVGAVHVGVVQVVHVRGSVEIRERDQLEGRLVPCEELSALLAEGANFETWSTLLIPNLGELLFQPIAAHS